VSSLGLRRWLGITGAVVLSASLVAGLLAFRVARGGPASASLGSLDMAAQLDFRCTLPVRLGGGLATVSLPDGQVTRAPASMGPHDQGETFSAGRWLPVGAEAVSPDGGSYAYLAYTSGSPDAGGAATTLFAHDIRTGRERKLWTGPGQAMLIRWAPEGVYLDRLFLRGDENSLWLVDPVRPSAAHEVGPNPPQVSSIGSAGPLMFGTIGQGAAWAITASHPPPPPGGAVHNDELVRMDLRDGSVTTWLRVPGREVRVLGIDPSGRPLIGLSPPSIDVGGVVYPQFVDALALVTGRDQAVPVAMPDPGAQPDFPFTDAHGTWLAGPGSLWLYRAGRLEKVASVPATVARPEPQPSLPAGVPGQRPGALLIPLGPCR
jgi:hypothetical protein